jgi:hypothetical protein
MEPLDEQELSKLLRKWEAPNAPARLRSPVPRPRQSPWRWLWSGRIHIPVPVGAAIVVVAAALWLHSNKAQSTAAPSVENAITRPVQTPTSPVPEPPVKQQRLAPPASRGESASLAGFHPVTQLEPKVILVRP